MNYNTDNRSLFMSKKILVEMPFTFSDGGRNKAGFKGTTGDCVVRAIAIIADKDYLDVYNDINEMSKNEKIGKRQSKKSNSRKGVYRKTYDKYLKELGFVWVPTMFIGSGCKVHLTPDELPKGKLIARLSRHITAVIDGVVYDTFNPSRGGTRCVYGYYKMN